MCEELLALPEQQLHERDRDQAADDAEHRVDDELERVHKLVGRDVKQGLVAEDAGGARSTTSRS